MRARPFHTKDIQQVCDLLRAFRSDPITPDYLKGHNEHTVMVERMIIGHFAPHTWVVDTGDEIVGVIVAHIGAMPLTPAVEVLEEIIFYVREDYRNTRAGAMLFSKWTAYAKKIRDDGDVQAVIMHTLDGSTIDMEHHGFVPLQKSYLMED